MKKGSEWCSTRLSARVFYTVTSFDANDEPVWGRWRPLALPSPHSDEETEVQGGRSGLGLHTSRLQSPQCSFLLATPATPSGRLGIPDSL